MHALLTTERVRVKQRGFIAIALIAAAFMLPPSSAHAAVEITNVISRLKADVMWASTEPHAGVFLWPNNSSASQEFDLLHSDGGYFRIRARHSGQCLMLDWRSGTETNGTRIIQYPYCAHGYSRSEWRRSWVDGSVQDCSDSGCRIIEIAYPILINRATGRCLDATNPYGGAPPAQAALQQWDCVRSANAWNLPNQAWRFDTVPTP